MNDATNPSSSAPWPAPLPPCLSVSRRGTIAILALNRVAKRNALSDELVLGMQTFFSSIPPDVQGVVMHGAGDDFCAGLDLNELKETTTAESFETSIIGQRLNDTIQFCKVPVVAVLHGAVIGGGLELAAAAHIRIAEESAYYALPEGTRGIFLGSGGSVRLPRLIGAAAVMDMMLSGRVYEAQEAHTILRLSQYLVGPGEGLEKGVELAARIARNAPLANFAIIQSIPRIVEQDPQAGLFTEMLMVGVAQGDDEAKARLRDFLERKANKVQRG
ncbi:crotonase/enoyl-CoA hydratase family protein [Pusillimonas noertemannii]|uniref:Enoyl-CoA hydratase/carnithine racemase n=2 Tax=Alcaligenaceae TaxID=506 RepID=A0A2U1CQ27_9BURK|nr:crotonase/enoyl-CoA hydratase family protein [Pusillimonas noertemannii]NYT67326.1 crotonase/enoyl-CoA hydratase family protein [Pusillimonas noertemannii]PVY68000.1 enoyl-CoA hydratase/carnithine racemase [Pusillimonas noertemannii]TFL12487.1 crotonase/enoyl-CoA hydratase family protein [Pusillimonas noertemannii]